MTKILIFIAILSLLLSNYSLVNLPTKEIVPGKSVGGLKLGTSVASIKKMMGEPDSVEKGEEGQKYFKYNYNADKKREYGLMLTIENDKVISIFVFGDNFVAPGGIKVGVSSKKVMDKYKDQIDKKYYLMAENELEGINIIFPRIGIGFMVKEDKGKNDELVTNIMILEPIPDWVNQ